MCRTLTPSPPEVGLRVAFLVFHPYRAIPSASISNLTAALPPGCLKISDKEDYK